MRRALILSLLLCLLLPIVPCMAEEKVASPFKHIRSDSDSVFVTGRWKKIAESMTFRLIAILRRRK